MSLNPNIYRPVVCWMLNGQFNDDSIVHKINEFYENGFGGVMPVPLTNHPFLKDYGFGDNLLNSSSYLTDEYMRHYAVIVEQCRKRNMFVWVWDDVFCPSGWAGGLILEKYPHLYGRCLNRHPKSQKSEIAEFKVIYEDLEYLYYIMPVSGVRTDILNPELGKRFIEINYDAYKKYFKDDFGKTILGFFTDEPGGAGCLNGLFRTQKDYADFPIPWSMDIERAFIDKFGYELIDQIPYLFHYNGSSARARKVRNDFGYLVQESFAKNFLNPIANWCRENNTLLMGHLNNDDRLEACLITNGDLIRQLRIMDIPGVDVICQYLSPNKEPERMLLSEWDVLPYNGNFPKFASSAANFNNTKFSLSEIGAAYGFMINIQLLKWIVDYHFVRGVNLFTFSQINYSNQGSAVENVASECGSGQPYWQFMKFLNDYIASTAEFITQGKPEIKVAVWNPITTIFRDKVERINDSFDGLCTFLLSSGVDYDIIGFNEIKQGKLPYNTIILPIATTLNEEEKKHLERLSSQITVIIPDTVNIVNAQIYKTNPFVYECKELFVEFSRRVYESLKAFISADIQYGEFPYLRFIKRRISENEVCYLLFNESDRMDFSGEINFAEKDWSVSVEDLHCKTIYKKSDNYYDIKASQTVAIRMTKESRFDLKEHQPFNFKNIKVAQWQITAAEQVKWNGDDFFKVSVDIKDASSLIEKKEFSGWVDYSGCFSVDSLDEDMRLHLEELKYAAQVFINDQPAGIILWRPFELIIDKRFLIEGVNKISIRVYNTLADYIRSQEFKNQLRIFSKSSDENMYMKITKQSDDFYKGIGFVLGNS